VNGFSITLAEAEAVSSAMQRASNQVSEQLSELERSAASKLSTWTGTAQHAYAQCKTEWDSAANQMQLVLARASRTLAEIAQNYQAVDQSNAGGWL
jgi:ESAT-6 family protein